MKKLDYIIGGVAIAAFFLLLAQLSSFFSGFTHIIQLLNLGILAIFIIDVVLRLVVSKNKLSHIRSNFLDLIVFVPLVQFLWNFQDTHLYVVIWQLVIVFMLISRARKINKLLALLSLKPAQLMLTSFALAIGTGTVLLMLPISAQSGAKTSLVDALFTATSATCVTGLIVKDTATYFSLFGQMVILGLIQVGGLGIMTFSISLSLLMRKKFQMHQQVMMKDVLDQEVVSTVKSFLLFIVKMTLLFECVGAVFLFAAWKGKFAGGLATAYHALFHSISAFCNAGFSTFSDSLMRFSADLPTNVVICLLIIVGGLGFIAISDVISHIKNRLSRKVHKALRFRAQTKMVFAVSVLLILIGFVVIYFAEGQNSFRGLPQPTRLLISFFQSVTTRTAGFNTCDISALSAPVLLCMLVLMFIGGSPGSTAGGIKTTTLAALWAVIRSGFGQKENVEICKRTVPNDIIKKAITIFSVSLCTVLVFIALLLYFEKKLFVDIVFETVSAFGTVGLSTGITPQLSLKGKLLISLLMFIGRLGPLTMAYAFMPRKPAVQYKYAEEHIMIG
jgi:trk system potassium uptake protein TrkH